MGISAEFIEENKKAANLVKPSNKFAPYTRAERAKRRKEVYRLHFEKGLPALKIAELMHVDKNTIYEDVRLLYREVAKGNEFIEFSDYYNLQKARLELQRGRLVEYLEKTGDFKKKIAIERLIADIDFKLLSGSEKIEHNSIVFWNRVKDTFNEVAKKKNLDYRTTTVLELIQISVKNRKKLDDLIGDLRAGQKAEN